MYSELWLTDRSRNVTGHNCEMFRYLAYHSGPHGYGIQHISQSMPLVTGALVHDALAEVVRLYVAWQRSEGHPDAEVTPTMVQLAVSKHTEHYRQLVEKRGLMGFEGTEDILKEQQKLLAALVYGWVRIALPELLQYYTILHVEEEVTYELSPRIRLMIRPDLVLRLKSTGEVIVPDFKTTAYAGDKYVEEWSNSPQMMLTSYVVREVLKLPVKSYYIYALYKGSRRQEWNEETARYDGPSRQQSPLVWPYFRPGTPPFEPDDWQPQWKYDCPTPLTCGKARGKAVGKPHRHTLGDQYVRKLVPDPYIWVQQLPEVLLREHFQELGPYEVNDYKVQQMLRSIRSSEEVWIEKVRRAYEAEAAGEWDSETVQNSLDSIFPRSYNCFPLGRGRCQFYDLCFKHAGWKKPLEGNYRLRRPHHEQERLQMQERGVPVPDEYGDFEEQEGEVA